ncbi:TPA: hypothetical protein N3A45_004039 [Salmonella enterica subsp. salamae serovar [1],40:z35:e,n,x,z15]|nr:hypothetical protein [Salmonella enterica subsp. salamae serovar [1],40:z35:e,n,x,z15]
MESGSDSYLAVTALFSEYSGNKKEGSGTPFANMSEYDILVLFYLFSGGKSYAVGRQIQSI